MVIALWASYLKPFAVGGTALLLAVGLLLFISWLFVELEKSDFKVCFVTATLLALFSWLAWNLGVAILRVSQ